jgi:hypothetical protein
MRIRRRVAEIDQALWAENDGVIDEADLQGLPEPARRWMVAAAGIGTTCSAAVRLRIEGQMRPKPGAPPFDIKADETIGIGTGFVWLARSRIGLFQMSVLDAYHDREGFMAGRFIGIVPLMNARGGDVTRSARHRLAAESALFPNALLPRDGIRWEPVDDERAAIVFTIDGETIPVTVRIDSAGNLTEVTMERWGDVGRDGFGLIPYGFAVEQHRTFEGITIASRVRGGWWYGSDRYDPDAASVFSFVAATFG